MLHRNFECKLDPKGRMSLPSAYRSTTTKKKSSYVITNSLFQKKKCLDVYSMKEWEKLEAKIQKMPSLKADVQAFQRFYMASGHEVSADSQSRLLIPQGLRKYAELEEEVMLVGMGHKFEIWPLKTWSELFQGLTDNFENILATVADLEQGED